MTKLFVNEKPYETFQIIVCKYNLLLQTSSNKQKILIKS
jgi:hypothetical protein